MAGPALYGSEFSPGAMVGSYVLDELYYRGNFTVLYRAHHERTDRPAAVKVLHQQHLGSSKALRRFHQEARALEQLHHPQIVHLLEAGELRDGRPYFATEWIDGQNLAEHISQHGCLSVVDAAAVLEQVGAALAAAHALGIIHRDLKAQNIVVSRTGVGFGVKLLDFGIAKWLERPAGSVGLTSTGMVLGTPVAMAPEQIRGESPDVRTDIYALGVLLHQLLTGLAPFRGVNAVEVEEMHLHAPPPRPSLLVPAASGFDSVVLQCLRKNPQERFQTVSAVIDAVRVAAAGFGSRASDADGRAVGVYVELRSPPERIEGELEETWDGAAELALHLRQRLTELELEVSLETSTALLGVGALPSQVEAERTCRAKRLLETLDLFAELTSLGSGRGIEVMVAVHAAVGRSEESSAGDHRWTGELISVSEWIPESFSAGVYGTASSLSDIEALFRIRPATNGSGLWRLEPDPKSPELPGAE